MGLSRKTRWRASDSSNPSVRLTRQIIGLMFAMLPLTAAADAIVRTTAMFADTIAEYYVEDDHVRLELEIGEADIAAFRNLLPDDIYRRLGYGEYN